MQIMFLNDILFCFVLLTITFNTEITLFRELAAFFHVLALSYVSSTVVLKRACGLLCKIPLTFTF